MMAKSHCTCTCIKSSKEYACCVWKHNKCAQVSHIMMIWEMKKSKTLTHNHNCLMETISFEVHHITLTSPTNMLTIILKAVWFFLLLFSLYIFLCIFFFIHNTQYALLLLIHVQLQCDLAIARNTCINICSLNCLNLFWNIKLVRLILCVCVCVCVCFGSICLTFFLLGDIFESLKCCFDLCLSSMFDYIHVCVFLPWKTPFLQAW